MNVENRLPVDVRRKVAISDKRFSGFGVAFLRNNRNKTRFLSLEMECESCPTSCRTT